MGNPENKYNAKKNRDTDNAGEYIIRRNEGIQSCYVHIRRREQQCTYKQESRKDYADKFQYVKGQRVHKILSFFHTILL